MGINCDKSEELRKVITPVPNKTILTQKTESNYVRRYIPKTKYKCSALLEPANLQSSSTIWLQEIMARLDDLQKLRALIDIEQRCFKHEIHGFTQVIKLILK